MIANSFNIYLPGVDSTLAIDDSDRHANLCGESILANIPKVYQSLSVTFRNISASVFNDGAADQMASGEAQEGRDHSTSDGSGVMSTRFGPPAPSLSALEKSMLYCGAAWKVNPQRGGNSVDTQGKSREALICTSGDTREIYTIPIIHSRINALPPQQSIFNINFSVIYRKFIPGQSRTVRRVFRCDDSSRVTGYPRNGHHANVRRVLPGAVSVYAGKTRKRNRASSLLKAPLKTRWSIHQRVFRCG